MLKSLSGALLGDLAALTTGADPLKLFELDTYDNLTQAVTGPNHGEFANVADPCWTGNFSGSGARYARRCQPSKTISVLGRTASNRTGGI